MQQNDKTCEFYLPRKRRNCKTTPGNGKRYCVEHSYLLLNEAQDNHDVKRRIPCPLDPKHSCFEHKLDGHLKKCNARGASVDQVYFERNINSGCCTDEETKRVSLKDICKEELFSIIQKARKLHSELVAGKVKTEILHHDSVTEELEDESVGVQTKKHLQQQASLIRHMELQNFIHDNCCYVEFGAGKGGLSHRIYKAVEKTQKNVSFVVIEKGGMRYKQDDRGPHWERLRIDIEHVCLEKVPSLQNLDKTIVGIGKHLCGGATDLMLRCLGRSAGSLDNCIEKHTEGLVLALCCHHQCDWRSYVGKEWCSLHGISAREFSIITTMTSWGTCGTRVFLNKIEKRKSKETEDKSSGTKDELSSQAEDNKSTDQTESDQPTDSILKTTEVQSLPGTHLPTAEATSNPGEQTNKYGLTPEERKEIGFICKRLIDMGRIHYLQSVNYTGHLVEYVSQDVSLENVAIIAKRTNKTL